MKKRFLALALAAVMVTVGLGACSSKSSSTSSTSAAATTSKNIKIGVCPGPYGDMVNQAIAPYLKKHGYTVQLVQFSDYVQPNQALASKAIDANLFQHNAYLQAFAKDNKLDIAKVGNTPTAGMGIWSNSLKNLKDIPNGAKVALPTDAVNLARSLALLQTQGLIQVKSGVDITKATANDVSSNPKNLQFVPMDAAQISRSLDSVSIGMIPGNYAISSKLDYSKALAVEKLAEDYMEVLVVRTSDVNSQLGKDLKAALASDEFHQAIENKNGSFKDFDKPAWYVQKYGK